jgi:hypothetical protein
MFGLNKNHYFGALLLGLVSLGQLQRITTPLFSFYVHDLVALAWLVDLCISHSNLIWRKTKALFQSNSFISLFLLGAGTWIVLGWIWQWYSYGFSFWPLAYSLRMFVYGAVAYTLIQINNARKILSNHDIGYGLEVFYPILMLFGWLQYFFIPDTRWLATLGWDDHLGRMIGTQFDPNFLGLLLVFASIWTVYQFQYTRHARYFITSLLVVAAIVVTWSRATYVTFLIAHATIIAVYFRELATAVSKKQKNLLGKKANTMLSILSFFLILIMVVGVAFVPKPDGEGGNLARTSTIQSRIQNSQTTIEDLDIPEIIIGKGLFVITNDAYNDKFERPNHSKLPTTLPAFLLSSIGYGGVILFATIAAYKGITIKNKRNILSKLIQTYPMFLLALLATLTHSFANASFTQPFVLVLLLSFLVLENSFDGEKRT